VTGVHSAGGARLNQFYTLPLCLRACRDLLDNCVGVDIDGRLHDEIRCWVHTRVDDFDETFHAAGLTQYRLRTTCTQPGNSVDPQPPHQPAKLKPSYDPQQTWPPPRLRLLTSAKQEAFEKCLAHSLLRAGARPNFTLLFTRCRYCRTPPLSHAACASMSTTTTTTTRDRGDRYGP